MADFEICIDKKTDNVVSFRPAGQPWGQLERKQPLIVIAKNITKADLFEMAGAVFSNYTTRAAADDAVYNYYKELNEASLALGEKDPVSGLYIIPPENQNELLQIKATILAQYPRPIITDIRRFQIPVATIKKGWFPDLDLDKLNDDGQDYQPMLDQAIPIDFSEKVAICKDKTTGTFKYLTEKVA